MKTRRKLGNAFLGGIVLLGCLLGFQGGHSLGAVTLEEFGYNVLRPPSHLPVVLIIVNYAGQPAIAHTNSYYEDLLRNRIAMYFRAMSDGRLTIQHAGTINVALNQGDLGLPDPKVQQGATSWIKDAPRNEENTNRPGRDLYVRQTDNLDQCKSICRADTRCSAVSYVWGGYCYVKYGLAGERPFGRMIEEAARSDFDFARYDANRDGILTEHELGFLIIDNATENLAANRPTSPRCIRTQQNIQICANLALAGHRSSLIAKAHELAHSLYTVDLYGNYNLSANLSLMGGSVNIQPFDDMQLFHLDPWHKMALGWHRPTVLSLRDSHMHIPLHARASDTPYNSYILYDPTRGTREYFMVEFRTPNQTSPSGVTRTIYDTAVPGTGVAIWHVNLGTDLKPRNLSEPPEHIPGVFALGANLDKFNANRVWGPGTETPPLRWTDGSSTGVKIWVHNFTANATDINISIGRQLTAVVAQPTTRLERDTDRPGGDFYNRETTTPEQCEALCRTDSRCRSFTHYQGRCWLKSSVPQARPLPGATSGVVPVVEPTTQLERDMDRPGGDFHNRETATPDQCAALCRGDIQCRSFTHYQGRCWLKSSVPQARPLPGATSGVVR